jgi:hypothetical protein
MTYQNASIQTEPDLQQQGPPTRWGEGSEWSEDIPRSFAPSATGLFVPSDEVFRAAGYRPGCKRLPRWSPQGRGWTYSGNGRVDVVPYGFGTACKVERFGNWWVIHRDDGYAVNREVLVFLGVLLVIAPKQAAAMRLAEYCSPHG